MPITAPTHISTPDGIVNVLQLTDLHLFADINKSLAGVRLHDNFVNCLNRALAEDIRCDLILVTGDLVNEMDKVIYDRIFKILENTGIPFACIAGNHDVTEELNTHLPFFERTFVPYMPDNRLSDKHRIVTEGWQILLIDSSIPGEVSGCISADRRKWLDDILSQSDKPAIIFMHHHTLALNSKWLDVHISEDSDLFWNMIIGHPQVKAVVNGHVHQEYTSSFKGITIYTTPATCYQFKKNSDDFALDPDADSGYRWLQLQPNGKFESWVERLAV